MPDPEIFSDDSMGATLPQAPESLPVDPICVRIDFKRGKGQCTMHVDATQLHAYLDRIGVTRDSYGAFKDRPTGGTSYSRVVDASYHKVSTEALLKVGGPHEFNLLEAYSNPPTFAILSSIAESVQGTVDAIVDHYRPIEISVRIHAKGGSQ